MKNYFELKAEYVDFQERFAVAEGEELVELQKAYEQWQKENDIVRYCKMWGEEIYGICPTCDRKECVCKVDEKLNDEMKVEQPVEELKENKEDENKNDNMDVAFADAQKYVEKKKKKKNK